MDKIPFSYFMSQKILVPFLTETKKLMALNDRYTWVGKDDRDNDELATKILVGVANISKISTIQKKPMLLFKRSPIQRDASVLNNIAESYDLWSDSKPYGEIIRTGVNLTVIAELPLEVEMIGSFLFWELEWNKEKFREYGITVTKINYMSQPTPAEQYPGSEVDSWQLGINIDVAIHEKYHLLEFVKEEAVKEFELIKNMAFRSLQFQMPTE